MYKIVFTVRNTLTGEVRNYGNAERYRSGGKAAKEARRMINFVTCNGRYRDDNEYTASVIKVKK